MVVHAGNWVLETFFVGSHDYKFFGSNVSAIQVIIRDSVSLI